MHISNYTIVLSFQMYKVALEDNKENYKHKRTLEHGLINACSSSRTSYQIECWHCANKMINHIGSLSKYIISIDIVVIN